MAMDSGTHVPGAWRHALDSLLERAGLDAHLQAGQWLALFLLTATLSAAACLVLTRAAGSVLLWQAVAAAAVGAAPPCLWLRGPGMRRRHALPGGLPGSPGLPTLGLA